MYVQECRHPWRSEEGVTSPGPGVTSDCELPDLGVEKLMTFIARLLNLLDLGDAQRFPGGWNAALEPLLWQLCGDAEFETTGLLWLTTFPSCCSAWKRYLDKFCFDEGLLTGVFHKMCGNLHSVAD